jgi:hypothetical protein
VLAIPTQRAIVVAIDKSYPELNRWFLGTNPG